MNSLFQTFKLDILDLFRKNYQKLVLKNPQVNFFDVLKVTQDECNIQSTTELDYDYLQEWFNLINQMSFLENQLDLPFYEIILHSADNGLSISKNERKQFLIENLNPSDFQLSLDTLALKNNQKWNLQNPFVSFTAQIKNKQYRLTLIHYSSTSNETSKLFIRSQPETSPHLDMFDLSENLLSTLKHVIQHKKNFIISGSTGSGKTTFLRSLIPLIDSHEHLVVLEDTYEIINQHKGQTSLLAQKDQAMKTLKDYCAYALRMSPDRLIIGEMRSNEVVPFVLAMNTGHKGLMSTIHSNSAKDAIHRAAILFTLYSETKDIPHSLILKMLCKNIDYVVHLENKKIV